MSVGGHQVRTKRELAAILQQLAAASADISEARNSGTEKIEFSFATQTIIPTLVPTASTPTTPLVSAERVTELQRHAKHGYGTRCISS